MKINEKDKLKQLNIAEDKEWETNEYEGPNVPIHVAYDIKKDMRDILKYYYKSLFKEVIEELPKSENNRVLLELAGGSGWAISMLSHLLKTENDWKQNSKFIFSDCSNYAIEKSKNMVKHVAEDTEYSSAQITDFLVSDSHSIDLADNSVEIVFISAGLHHMLNPNEVMQEVYRILKPGGLFLAIGEPLVPGYLKFIYGQISGAQRRARKLGIKEGTFTYREMVRMFNSAGFDEYKMVPNREVEFRKAKSLRSMYYSLTSIIPNNLFMKMLVTSFSFWSRK